MINMAGLAGMVELGFSAAISRTASYFLGGAAQVPSLGGIKYIKSLQGINLCWPCWLNSYVEKIIETSL